MIIRNQAYELFFTLVDSTDGETPILVGMPSVRYTQKGQALHDAVAALATLVEAGQPLWRVVLSAAEMDSEQVAVTITLAGALTREYVLETLPSADSLGPVYGIEASIAQEGADARITLAITRNGVRDGSLAGVNLTISDSAGGSVPTPAAPVAGRDLYDVVLSDYDWSAMSWMVLEAGPDFGDGVVNLVTFLSANSGSTSGTTNVTFNQEDVR